MRWLRLLLVLLLWAGPALAEEPLSNPGVGAEPSAEDMQVIAMMEILQLMDLVESMDLVEDMDVLLEENQDELQN